ncbi:hypothetical protein ACFQWB_13645 [Paenibacillus thermoaerophilus]|uniref:Uncharacterized protein n=1 Tax=Paenibacillus thermoaerophilus TaxID=1215385 RepID=A0ABW2V877_9BACL|nr:hypothetical protein [Paenibacillus thermoaerophilus]TMV16132.1 hypothetical protein FE781_08675 [Paenibacillus thermoaerophilus]
MPRSRHHNQANEDGQIYCCLRNRIVKLDEKQKQEYCGKCPMFRDWLESGVVCEWEDARGLPDPHIAIDPVQEFRDNQKRKVPLARSG